LQASAGGSSSESHLSGENAANGTNGTDGVNVAAEAIGAKSKAEAGTKIPGARLKPWSLVLRGISSIESVQGAVWEETTQGIRLNPAAGINEITVHLRA
jgi:hypothetical protein